MRLRFPYPILALAFVVNPLLARQLPLGSIYSRSRKRGAAMQNRISLIAVAAILALAGACGRTESGDVVVKKPVDVDVTTKPETITTKTETVNAPVIGTQKDTVVINKPVIGSKKTEVKVPTVKKP